eukprot:scaffold162304_cov22-Tisochrysis_lutea.AAC.1
MLCNHALNQERMACMREWNSQAHSTLANRRLFRDTNHGKSQARTQGVHDKDISNWGLCMLSPPPKLGLSSPQCCVPMLCTNACWYTMNITAMPCVHTVSSPPAEASAVPPNPSPHSPGCIIHHSH